MRSLVLCFLLLGCASAAPRVASPHTELDADGADGVHGFVSVPRGFHTRSYWIEGPDGVVVIDTQFMPSEAERLLDTIARETSRPVVLALALHPNPDKFNGAQVFADRGIPVMTSAQVLAEIPHVHEIRTRAFRDRYAPDYPDALPPLTSFGDRTRTLDVAGLALRLHVLGRGCSEAHVVVEHRGHVFVGDLVAQGAHSWMELGYLPEWHARLDEIAALSPRRVHPGRGESGGVELLAAEHAYLSRVEAIVRAASPADPAPEGALDAVRARIEAEYPTLAYPVFLRMGVPAVWARIAREPE